MGVLLPVQLRPLGKTPQLELSMHASRGRMPPSPADCAAGDGICGQANSVKAWAAHLCCSVNCKQHELQLSTVDTLVAYLL